MTQKTYHGTFLICCIFYYVLYKDKMKERQDREGKSHGHSDTLEVNTAMWLVVPPLFNRLAMPFACIMRYL